MMRIQHTFSAVLSCCLTLETGWAFTPGWSSRTIPLAPSLFAMSALSARPGSTSYTGSKGYAEPFGRLTRDLQAHSSYGATRPPHLESILQRTKTALRVLGMKMFTLGDEIKKSKQQPVFAFVEESVATGRQSLLHRLAIKGGTPVKTEKAVYSAIQKILFPNYNDEACFDRSGRARVPPSLPMEIMSAPLSAEKRLESEGFSAGTIYRVLRQLREIHPVLVPFIPGSAFQQLDSLTDLATDEKNRGRLLLAKHYVDQAMTLVEHDSALEALNGSIKKWLGTIGDLRAIQSYSPYIDTLSRYESPTVFGEQTKSPVVWIQSRESDTQTYRHGHLFVLERQKDGSYRVAVHALSDVSRNGVVYNRDLYSPIGGKRYMSYGIKTILRWMDSWVTSFTFSQAAAAMYKRLGSDSDIDTKYVEGRWAFRLKESA